MLDRILIVHNRYIWRGGEDAVVEEEAHLLRERGHEVRIFERSNTEATERAGWKTALDAVSNREALADFEAAVASFEPQLVHVHNTWMRISPAVIRRAAQLGLPVVQSLHNFRLSCPQAMLLRDSRPCEDCVGRTVAWPAVLHRCYRDSVLQTGILTATLALHRHWGTYTEGVDRFIALNTFCRDKFIEAGLPADRIAVKPNFVRDPQVAGSGPTRHGGLYVGRLSEEKGMAALLGAATLGRWDDVRVAGDGPWAERVAAHPHLQHLGPQPPERIPQLMREASFLMVPSIWYENFPRTIVESYAAGLPVIASRIGSLARLVEDGRTGLLVEPDQPEDLEAKVRWALEHPAEMAEMGRQARALYEREYTPQANYPTLLAIYQAAAERAAARRATQAGTGKASKTVG